MLRMMQANDGAGKTQQGKLSIAVAITMIAARADFIRDRSGFYYQSQAEILPTNAHRENVSNLPLKQRMATELVFCTSMHCNKFPNIS
jgi:hypothetical protein